jgi:hypothetical protein
MGGAKMRIIFQLKILTHHFRNFGLDGHAVAWMVEALCYKPEGSGFESQRGYCISLIYLLLPAQYDPEVYSASNRYKYQKIFGGG